MLRRRRIKAQNSAGNTDNQTTVSVKKSGSYGEISGADAGIIIADYEAVIGGGNPKYANLPALLNSLTQEELARVIRWSINRS